MCGGGKKARERRRRQEEEERRTREILLRQQLPKPPSNYARDEFPFPEVTNGGSNYSQKKTASADDKRTNVEVNMNINNGGGANNVSIINDNMKQSSKGPPSTQKRSEAAAISSQLSSKKPWSAPGKSTEDKQNIAPQKSQSEMPSEALSGVQVNAISEASTRIGAGDKTIELSSKPQSAISGTVSDAFRASGPTTEKAKPTTFKAPNPRSINLQQPADSTIHFSATASCSASPRPTSVIQSKVPKSAIQLPINGSVVGDNNTKVASTAQEPLSTKMPVANAPQASNAVNGTTNPPPANQIPVVTPTPARPPRQENIQARNETPTKERHRIKPSDFRRNSPTTKQPDNKKDKP